MTTNVKKWIKLPTVEAAQLNKEIFYNVAKFPGVIGALDCTHIPIKSPGGENAELYRNRKGWMSINTQIVCGPNMEILDLVCRWPGSTHDSRIFNNSRIKHIMESGVFPNCHLIADSGYAQTKYLYTPKLSAQSLAENKYNKAHISTRNIIERTNGVLKSRFRCLCRKLRTKLKTSTLIIICCAMLHNIALRHNLNLNLDVGEEEIILPRADMHVMQEQRPGNIIKAMFIERYFH